MNKTDMTDYYNLTVAMWFITASWSLAGRLLYPVMEATGVRLERSYSHDPV